MKTLRQQISTYRPPPPHEAPPGIGPAPVTSKPIQLTVPPAPSALSVPLTTQAKQDCFWTKDSWDTFIKRQKAANREPPWNAFITDENGIKMPPQWHRELWEDAKLAFNSLYYHRLDPASWAKKHSVAAEYFYNTIGQKYPQFQLCERNWKLHTWTTRRYADWAKNVRGSGGLSRMIHLFSIRPH